jgi:hypothetical protein
MNLLRKTGNLCTRIPAIIWVAILTPIIGIAGSEIQRWIDTSAYPTINKERIKSLEGTWSGYGIQQIQDEQSAIRLRDRGTKIGTANTQEIKTLTKDYDTCTFQTTKPSSAATVWFPAHLTLKIQRTSFWSTKSLQGTLTLSPVLEKTSHPDTTYTVAGRLEQNGDYIRLDYSITDPGKKDFGTLLLQDSGDSALCGQFLSYGPISRGIVNGKYIFTSHKQDH